MREVRAGTTTHTHRTEKATEVEMTAIVRLGIGKSVVVMIDIKIIGVKTIQVEMNVVETGGRTMIMTVIIDGTTTTIEGDTTIMIGSTLARSPAGGTGREAQQATATDMCNITTIALQPSIFLALCWLKSLL